MKTLDQIEPRSELNAANAPGEAGSIFKISQAGSHYLPRSIQGGTGRVGILIAASNVTLDLTGFELVGATGALQGIIADSDTRNLVVRNGVVRNWGDTAGLDLSNAPNSLVENIRSSDNSGTGIVIGLNAIITHCTAMNNEAGIGALNGSLVSECTANSNISTGIILTTGRVNDCVANTNGNDGINAGSGTTVTGCTAECWRWGPSHRRLSHRKQRLPRQRSGSGGWCWHSYDWRRQSGGS